MIINSGKQDATTIARNEIADDKAYGSMYEHSTGVDLSLSSGGTYYKWSNSVQGTLKDFTYSSGYLIPHSTGAYFATINASFTGTVNTTYVMSLFVDDIKNNTVDFERKIGTNNDIGAGGATDIVELTTSNAVDLKVTADGDSKVWVAKHCNVALEKA